MQLKEDRLLTNGWAPHSTVHVDAVAAALRHDVVHIEGCIHYWLRVWRLNARLQALSASFDHYLVCSSLVHCGVHPHSSTCTLSLDYCMPPHTSRFQHSPVTEAFAVFQVEQTLLHITGQVAFPISYKLSMNSQADIDAHHSHKLRCCMKVASTVLDEYFADRNDPTLNRQQSCEDMPRNHCCSILVILRFLARFRRLCTK